MASELKLSQTPSGMTVINVYQDNELRSLYIQILRETKEEAASSTEAQISYFLSILENAYQSLQRAGRQVNKKWKMPDAFVDLPVDDDEARDLYTDERGIHVGLGLIWELECAVLAFTQFLLKNYCFQMFPIGEAPPLSKLVTPDAFPLEALKLYAANLIPEAIAKDGYEKRPILSIIESLETARFTKASPEELRVELSRRHAKPPLDLRIWLRDFNLGDSIDQYFDDALGPYCLALNYQLMLDGVHFMLAHEMAHFLLGHYLCPDLDFAQSRAEEVEADKLALEILQLIPGFQLRSLLSLFGFFHLTYETPTMGATTPSSKLLTHPFSRDRMLILCDTVLQDPQGEALRADVNAGMSMLSTPLKPIPILYRWEDGFEEMLTAYAYHYSDMDYTTHLLLYLERPPRSVESHEGAKQNAFILSRLNLEIHLVLRDRINPEKTFYRGRVLFRPGMSTKGDLLFHDPETPMCRLHTRFVAPPEWWLTHSNTVLAIEGINPAEELLPEPDDIISPVLQYDMQLVKLDCANYLQSLSSQEEDVTARATVLLAARRFHEERLPDLSVLFYEWIYRSNEQTLLYPDLINMVFDLMELNRLPDAAQIAQRALSGDQVMRPGFHYVLSVYFSNRGQFPKSMEHAFLEWLGIGEFGEYTEQAKTLYYSLLENPNDPLMILLRKFHFHYASAEEYEQIEQTSKALRLYRQASEDLQKASQLAQTNFVFLRQYAAETLKKICILEEQGFHPAKKAFEAIRKLAPQFVPAYVQLAGIALLEDDLPRARALWKEANAIMPFNHFVLSFREQVEEPNPDIMVKSKSMKELFQPPPGDKENREE